LVVAHDSSGGNRKILQTRRPLVERARESHFYTSAPLPTQAEKPITARVSRDFAFIINA
jgi:hypothetical protein